MLCYVMLYYIILYYIILYYIISYYILYHILLYYIIFYYIISYGTFGGDQIDGNFEGFPLIIVHCEGVGNIMTPLLMGIPNSHQLDTPTNKKGPKVTMAVSQNLEYTPGSSNIAGWKMDPD